MASRLWRRLPLFFLLLTDPKASNPDGPNVVAIGGLMVLTLLIHALGFWGGLSMYRMQSFGLAVTSTVIGYLSFCGPCWMVGLPFAVWATVVLAGSGTHALFRGELPPVSARSTADASRGTGVAIIVVVAVLAVPVLIGGVGVASALAIYGVRRYVFTAKTEEAKAAVRRLAQGIAACHDETGSLPLTSSPVPPALRDVAGQKYQSAPTEWQQPAFDCAGFEMPDPQYYQYSWELDPSGTSGSAVARGDLDGDGTPSEFRVRVECAVACEVASLTEESSPLE